ncbi:ABC transporter permease [Lysinibacillus sp. LZ02]|uniref:ABC transporter permease n=1 Tax=Lysinibacillus sp. LZ02 TaxID=3420668 RepID=UPI003D35E27F
MFLALIRKQLKVLWRNPQELLLLLLLPIILINIIGFALGSLMGQDSEAIQIDVALLQQDDEQQGLQAFVETMALDEQTEERLVHMLPVSMLVDQVFENAEMQGLLTVTNLKPSELEAARSEGDYSAIIEVPKGFTEAFYMSIFAGGERPALQVYLNDDKEITASVIQRVLDSYQYQYSLMTQLASNGYLSEETALPEIEIASSISTVNEQEPISTSAYYTFSMSVMFILYMAGTIASQAYLEKQMHIFDRILLANMQPAIYLVAICMSTIILSMLQIGILFVVAHFMFDISFMNAPMYLVVTFMLALVVGTIAALLSALNYRINSAGASNAFSTTFVAILALLGGSFFSFDSFAPTLAAIGNWTPNGAALQSYLALQQGGTFEQIASYMGILGILAILCFVAAFVLFPRRGGVV